MTFRPLSPFRPFDPFKYGTRTLASQVRALFANGEQGAIYGTDFSTLFQDAGPTNPVTAVEQQVGYRLDMSGRGNHLVQATATKRAYVSRRVNLLVNSEFAGAVTGTPGTPPTGWANATATGEITGVTGGITVSASGTRRSFRQTVQAKSGHQTRGVIRAIIVSGPLAVSGILGHISGNVSSVQYYLNGLAAGENLNLPEGIEFELRADWVVSTTGNFTMDVGIGVGAVATGIITIRNASLTLAIDSHLPYQSVNTATVYDADPSKFPTLERYDGIDDSASSSTGGGGTAGFFFSSAITVAGGAGTNRVLFSDAGTNTGYIVRINASNQLELAAGNGTSYTAVASVATLTAPVNAVVQAWDDGTNLNVRINDGAVASVARPTVSAGTAGYTIGQDNGASTGYFNGREYSTLYRKDSGLTADQRDKVRRYQLQQARFV